MISKINLFSICYCSLGCVNIIYIQGCHLDLCLENIMLKNGNFIENEDGTISINGAVSAKLCDFGVAEIFKPKHDGDHRAFRCVKTGSILGEIQYHSPRILDKEVYDARKADNWALGMMLFECFFGRTLYNKIDEKQGSGYFAAMNNKINQFISFNFGYYGLDPSIANQICHIILFSN